MKKFILLFLALLLPGLIFVFLKNFGKNEFAIPSYYKNSADSVNAICGTRYENPYRVSSLSLDSLGWKKRPATLIIFSSLSTTPELKRLGDGFETDEFQVIEAGEQKNIGQLRSCVFLAREGKDGVLMDSTRQIRGFYNVKSRKDIDRLMLEMEILLKKY